MSKNLSPKIIFKDLGFDSVVFGWYVMLPAEPVNDVNTNVWLDECERKIFNPNKIGKLFIFRMLIKLCKYVRSSMSQPC